MTRLPDTNILDLHRAEAGPMAVDALEGRAWLVKEGDKEAVPVSPGTEVAVGDVLALAAGARVRLGGLLLQGGNRGRAHGLVGQDAFRTAPNRADVPRLLNQLLQIEREMEPLGEDPLTMQPGPVTPHERAASAEFARQNLDEAAARRLSEGEARAHRAVVLFYSEDTAFVAFERLTVPRLRAVMEALHRPVNPHLVTAEMLDELLMRVYR
ncbi:MAG: hypothetical protein KC933_07025 [Myxococcales bacterium]|nr:hypothetical protein [Myxococcales bacterium]MCB9645418.1 hypothetical protein [Deltaproteobacteria bacterium]